MNGGEPRYALHADDIGDAEDFLEARESVAVFGTDVHAIAGFHQGMDQAHALYQRRRDVDMETAMSGHFALTVPGNAKIMCTARCPLFPVASA